MKKETTICYCKDVSEFISDIPEFDSDTTEIFSPHLGPPDLEQSIADTYATPPNRNKKIAITAGIATGVAATALAAEELIRRKSGEQTLIQNAVHYLPNIRHK